MSAVFPDLTLWRMMDSWVHGEMHPLQKQSNQRLEVIIFIHILVIIGDADDFK